MKTTDITPGQLYRMPSGETATVVHISGRGRNRKVKLSAEVTVPGFRRPQLHVPVVNFAWHAVAVEPLGRPLVPLTRCAAGKDGECNHEGCPQLRDGEPAKSDRFCPLPGWGDDEE